MDEGFTFYLGVHRPHWLRTANVPTFVSRNTLGRLKAWPVAAHRWAFDSGMFTRLQRFGLPEPAADYARLVRRAVNEVGNLDWAAPQDWMCEPAVIGGLVARRKAAKCKACKKGRSETVGLDADERPVLRCRSCGHRWAGKPPGINIGRWRAWASSVPVMASAALAAAALGIDAVVVFHGTGLSVLEHQRRTVANYLELRQLDLALPIIPVLQGWEYADYWRCWDLYDAAGVDLAALPLVGLGSVCRRQDTGMAEELVRDLATQGLHLHLFGFKLGGLARAAAYAASADSMAWSYAGRRDTCGVAGHTHKNAANCLDYALRWRERVAGVVEAARRRPRQLTLF